jgi:hypothetical protein
MRFPIVEDGDSDLFGANDGEKCWGDRTLASASCREELGEAVGEREGNEIRDLSDGVEDVMDVFVLILLDLARTVPECPDLDEF